MDGGRWLRSVSRMDDVVVSIEVLKTNLGDIVICDQRSIQCGLSVF